MAKQVTGTPGSSSATTTPGKGWNTILRLYSPLKPWFDKAWSPGEIELLRL
jgi:hypothetical protein